MFRDSSAILFLLPKQLNLVPGFLGQRFNNLQKAAFLTDFDVISLIW